MGQQLQGDLHCLKEDIATVERRRQELVSAKSKFAKRGRLMTITNDAVVSSSLNSDTLPGCEKANSNAVSVFRGGQGGAFVPSGEPKSWTTGTTPKKMIMESEKMATVPGKFLESPYLESHYHADSAAGLQTVSKKRRVLAQVLSSCPFVKFLISSKPVGVNVINEREWSSAV